MYQAAPIVPWIGGKRRLADRLLPYFPPHSCYVEPFAGGAAMFFMRPRPAEVEVLNDVNGDLVNLYRVVKTTWKSSFANSSGCSQVGRFSSG